MWLASRLPGVLPWGVRKELPRRGFGQRRECQIACWKVFLAKAGGGDPSGAAPWARLWRAGEEGQEQTAATPGAWRTGKGW